MDWLPKITDANLLTDRTARDSLLATLLFQGCTLKFMAAVVMCLPDPKIEMSAGAGAVMCRGGSRGR